MRQWSIALGNVVK